MEELKKILSEAERTPRPSETGGIRQVKNFIHLIGSQTRDLRLVAQFLNPYAATCRTPLRGVWN
jgi:hypothetical protein